MSMTLDAEIANTGTRFKLFTQARYLPSFSEPETVVVSVPPGLIQPGPADDRMFVVDAIGKKPYVPNGSLPQWQGGRHPAVRPGQGGHYDDIALGTRAFSCATMYATVRRVLDIWQDYFGRDIEWFFRLHFARLELIPILEWDNAQSGYGFLEFGFGRLPLGGLDYNNPYCQNFDVLAHELGHAIINAEVGVPSEATVTAQYGGFHESSGDLVAIVACLHFNSVVDYLLGQTSGNLFTVNELVRLGELSDGREIRVAFNYERMSTVTEEPHHLSLPLTGAIFDIFVDVFQTELVKRGLISAELAARSTHGVAPNSMLAAIQREFDEAYLGHEADFKVALLTARDYLGRLLAHTWSALEPDYLSYRRIGRALMDADRLLTNGANHQSIRSSFAWREITLVDPSLMLHRLTDCGFDDGYVYPAAPQIFSHSAAYALAAPARSYPDT